MITNGTILRRLLLVFAVDSLVVFLILYAGGWFR